MEQELRSIIAEADAESGERGDFFGINTRIGPAGYRWLDRQESLRKGAGYRGARKAEVLREAIATKAALDRLRELRAGTVAGDDLLEVLDIQHYLGIESVIFKAGAP